MQIVNYVKICNLITESFKKILLFKIRTSVFLNIYLCIFFLLFSFILPLEQYFKVTEYSLLTCFFFFSLRSETFYNQNDETVPILLIICLALFSSSVWWHYNQNFLIFLTGLVQIRDCMVFLKSQGID